MRRIALDPITRIEGHLGAIIDVDEETRTPTDSRVYATMFRGFEVFLRGRPPEDAIAITSRICGVCGASHANASTHATDMALGVVPKPMGVILRNLAFVMTDCIYDHSIILNLLGGPDYSAALVKKLTPATYRDAQEVLASNRDIHGFTKISDIMDALNPLSGRIWLLTIKYQRIAKEAGVMIYGRYPHPSALIPGGIMTDLSNPDHLLLGYVSRLTKLTAWAKFIYTVWEDLVGFFEENAGYSEQGKTYDKPNYVSGGLFDDPEAYSALGESPEEIYSNIDDAAIKRWVKPGVILNGELVSKSYREINLSIMEHVETALYSDWKAGYEVYTETDPNGNRLLWGHVDPAYHPWNKTTIPELRKRDFDGKYSWAANVRLVWKDGTITPFEVGPIARMTVTSYQDNPFSGGAGVLSVELPKSGGAEGLPNTVIEPMTLTWRAPPFSTTLQRVLARAFCIVYDIGAGWINVLKALELVGAGKVETSTPWKHPQTITFGVGFTEAPRGTVRHWVIQREGKIVNYQVHAPTTGNASPKDAYGRAPFEISLLNSKVTEELSPGEWWGLDYVRAIRSFDPCIACAVHVNLKQTSRKIEHLLTEMG